MRDRHPHLPWRAILGVGNVYRHDYDNVAEEFVWRTVQHGLPEMRRGRQPWVCGGTLCYTKAYTTVVLGKNILSRLESDGAETVRIFPVFQSPAAGFTQL